MSPNLEPTPPPEERSRIYLLVIFDGIEERLEAGEIDIKDAELKRTEAYEFAVHNIGIPRFEDE